MSETEESLGTEPVAKISSGGSPQDLVDNVTNNAIEKKTKDATAKKSKSFGMTEDGSFFTESYASDFDAFDENFNKEATATADDVSQLIDKQNAQTLAATQNMVGLMEEGRVAGYKARTDLYQQGEKLKTIDHDVDSMGSKFRNAESALDKVEGKTCCGCFGVKKKKKMKDRNKSKKMKYKKVGDVDEQDRQRGNFKYVTGDAKERQMADNLDMVSDILDEMDAMADDLNAEIKGQNRQIEKIQAKGKTAKQQVDRVNEKGRRVASGRKPPDSGGGLGGGVISGAMGM